MRLPRFLLGWIATSVPQGEVGGEPDQPVWHDGVMVKLVAPPLPTLSLHPPHVGTIPMLGLGTWPLTGRQAYQVVRMALELGYRHIDTATMYGNEADIGAAITDCGVEREQIFLTTKLPADHVGPALTPGRLPPTGPSAVDQPGTVARPLETLQASLQALDTAWVDLWLLHSPPEADQLVSTWQQMITAWELGWVRAIGVSNFTPEQIDYLSASTGVMPAVHQVQWSPHSHDPAALEHARANRIVLQGYSPFSQGGLDEPLVISLAQRYRVTPAQIVLRWHLDQGVVAIPRSGRYEHLAANLEVTTFTLEPHEVEELNALRSQPSAS